ncbi:hypothetical protein BH23CHL8_BH23CHL8_15150 [soil metagenome]
MEHVSLVIVPYSGDSYLAVFPTHGPHRSA